VRQRNFLLTASSRGPIPKATTANRLNKSGSSDHPDSLININTQLTLLSTPRDTYAHPLWHSDLQTATTFILAHTFPLQFRSHVQTKIRQTLTPPQLCSLARRPLSYNNIQILVFGSASLDYTMVCTSPSLTVESYEDITAAHSSAVDEYNKPNYRRRHSSFHPTRRSSSVAMDGEEGLLLKVLHALLVFKQAS
jgi:hypothetical protein